MQCSEAEPWICVTVDGAAIPASVVGSLDEHLSRCPKCQAILRSEERHTALLAKALSDSRGEEELVASILRGVRSVPAAVGVVPFPRRGVKAFLWLAAAASLLVGATAWFLFTRTPVSRRPRFDVAEMRLRLETHQDDLDLVPGADGLPWGRRVHEVEEVILDPANDARASIERGSTRDLPRVLRTRSADTRYIKMVDWSYR